MPDTSSNNPLRKLFVDTRSMSSLHLFPFPKAHFKDSVVDISLMWETIANFENSNPSILLVYADVLPKRRVCFLRRLSCSAPAQKNSNAVPATARAPIRPRTAKLALYLRQPRTRRAFLFVTGTSGNRCEILIVTSGRDFLYAGDTSGKRCGTPTVVGIGKRRPFSCPRTSNFLQRQYRS